MFGRVVRKLDIVVLGFDLSKSSITISSRLFFSHDESLRGCVVEAVPPLRQPLPAGQTARRCAFAGQRTSNRETWACTYGSASGREQFNDLLRSYMTSKNCLRPGTEGAGTDAGAESAGRGDRRAADVTCFLCFDSEESFLVLTECPCVVLWRPEALIAGCLSLQRLGMDIPITRPVWGSNPGPPASESTLLTTGL